MFALSLKVFGVLRFNYALTGFRPLLLENNIYPKGRVALHVKWLQYF